MMGLERFMRGVRGGWRRRIEKGERGKMRSRREGRRRRKFCLC